MGNIHDELRRLFPHVVPRPCRKIGYVNRQDAEAHLAGLLTSPDVIDPAALYIYRCRNCSQFHVGHEKEKKP